MARASRIPWASLLFLVGCSHVFPANWRAFEGNVPKLRPIVVASLESQGFVVVIDETPRPRVVTQWQYAAMDMLSRQRHRVVVHWEFDEKEKSKVIYVRHERQNIDDSIDFDLEYLTALPSQELEAKLLDDITKRILNSSP